MPSQTSINSPISLNLPQRPNSSNPDVVASLVPVFAALRILQDELNKLTGGTGQTGNPGQTGLQGIPGSQIYYGVTEPSTSLGRAGDYYINTSLSSLYTKLGSSTWQWILNLGNGSVVSNTGYYIEVELVDHSIVKVYTIPGYLPVERYDGVTLVLAYFPAE